MKVTAGQIQYGAGKCPVCSFVLPLDQFEQWKEGEQLMRSRRCIVCESGNVRQSAPKPLSQRKLRMCEKRGEAYYRKREMIQGAKKKPCADCGNSFPPVCMEFDHMPGHEKEYNIATMMNHSVVLIMAEIAKCEIVCACCHRIRSAKRGWRGGRKRITPDPEHSGDSGTRQPVTCG